MPLYLEGNSFGYILPYHSASILAIQRYEIYLNNNILRK